MLQERAQARRKDRGWKGLFWDEFPVFLSSTEQTPSLRDYGGNCLHSASVPGFPEVSRAGDI